MDPISLIILLVACGIVLLIGELLLPTHGMLGILGVLCFGAAIGVCFQMNKWIGLGVFFVAVIASPFALGLAMSLWARTPVGRRMILAPLETSRAPSPIKLGQIGISVNEMRPLGECDFGDQRIEAISELGVISPGAKVTVVAIDNGRPTVRAVEA